MLCQKPFTPLTHLADLDGETLAVAHRSALAVLCGDAANRAEGAPQALISVNLLHGDSIVDLHEA